MATRVSKVSVSGEANIIRKLKSKVPRPEGTRIFTGLKRNEYLSDVADPGESLNNILDKLSTLSTSERNQYGGPYNAADWAVTSEFVNQGINQSYLTPLSGVSVGGGSLGNTVSLTPRLRIEDRINFANFYFGDDSFAGLHNGPDAQFYVSDSQESIGKVKISGLNPLSLTLYDEDEETTLVLSTLLDGKSRLVLDIVGYQNINLVGQNISLLYKENTTSWEVLSGLENLSQIQTILGISVFANTFFNVARDYSALNPPPWFREDIGTSTTALDGLDPQTSQKVLRNESGVFLPLVNRGYWFTGSYVESRWTESERSLIGSNAIVQDSNMRWFNPPAEVRGKENNWGIRWDGYLRFTPGIYVFQVQSNIAVKIDLYRGGTWESVFDTSTAAKEGEDTYLSLGSFTESATGYLPISIRIFHGGPDKAETGLLIPSFPDLFIKTAILSSEKNFYSGQYSVVVSGTGVTGDDIGGVITILSDANRSITTSLVDSEGVVTTVTLSTDGTTVTVTDSPGDGTYTLVISPNRSPIIFLAALWKGRIASPSVNHISYSDLVEYDPDILSTPFDLLPEWWKISQGHPYNSSSPINRENTPLDGLVPNKFKSSLQSIAAGTGLYGNGSGTYTNRPNIILGEAKYAGTTDELGSNYIGLSLKPNFLGEGGRLIIRGYPINNSTFNASNILDSDDIGAGTNQHLTAANGKITHRIAQLTLDTVTNRYFLHADPEDAAIVSDDDPTSLGLPPFSSTSWLSPITISATQVANDSGFTTEVKPFVAPLVMLVEKYENGSGNNLISFSTTLASLQDGGSDVGLFSGKYVKFYTEDNVAFQYLNVDTGEGLSFSDILKLTYSPGFNGPASEVPRPVSDRVLPFGTDDPDLCYPPYDVSNPLLSAIAVDDTTLYGSTEGHYDVYWGNQDQSDLEEKTLTITEKIEFSGTGEFIETLSGSELTDTTLNREDYSHRLRFDIPLNPALYADYPDVLNYLGNGEKVKDSYYCFVKLS